MAKLPAQADVVIIGSGMSGGIDEHPLHEHVIEPALPFIWH